MFYQATKGIVSRIWVSPYWSYCAARPLHQITFHAVIWQQTQKLSDWLCRVVTCLCFSTASEYCDNPPFNVCFPSKSMLSSSSQASYQQNRWKHISANVSICRMIGLSHTHSPHSVCVEDTRTHHSDYSQQLTSRRMLCQHERKFLLTMLSSWSFIFSLHIVEIVTNSWTTTSHELFSPTGYSLDLDSTQSWLETYRQGSTHASCNTNGKNEIKRSQKWNSDRTQKLYV